MNVKGPTVSVKGIQSRASICWHDWSCELDVYCVYYLIAMGFTGVLTCTFDPRGGWGELVVLPSGSKLGLEPRR